MFNLLGWLIVGGVAGWLASAIMNVPGGLVRNIIIGIVGSLVGGLLGRLIGLYTAKFSIAAIIVAVVGACLCLFLEKKFLK